MTVQPKKITISGYVNTTSRDSRVITHPTEGRFIEQIAPKAFERALGRTDDLPLLLNHKKDKKLASIKQRTLQLYEDPVGLRCIATIDHPEIIQKANNGELISWSFGFKPIETRFEEIRNRKDGIKRRIIQDMILTDVSILDKSVNACYTATSLEVRGIPFSNFDLDKYLLEKYIEISKMKGGIR